MSAPLQRSGSSLPTITRLSAPDSPGCSAPSRTSRSSVPPRTGLRRCGSAASCAPMSSSWTSACPAWTASKPPGSSPDRRGRPAHPHPDHLRPGRVRLRRAVRRSQRFPAQGRYRGAALRRGTDHRGRPGAARADRHPASHQRIRPAAPQAGWAARGRARRADPAGNPGTAAGRRGPVQPGDSGPPGGHRRDRENACQPRAEQAGPARPDASGRHRLRVRAGRAALAPAGIAISEPAQRAQPVRRPAAAGAPDLY